MEATSISEHMTDVAHRLRSMAIVMPYGGATYAEQQERRREREVMEQLAAIAEAVHTLAEDVERLKGEAAAV